VIKETSGGNHTNGDSGSSSDRHLITILSIVTEALASGSSAPLDRILSPSVVWDGRYPGQGCAGKQTVLALLDRGFAEPRRIQRLEVSLSGTEISITAEGEGFVEVLPDGLRIPSPSATLTFTFRGDEVIRIQGG